jgi:NhaP-type Na+/H+ or K+/H+ antiporter
VQVLTFDHIVDWGLLVSGIPLCLLSRAANIFPLSRLANLGRQVKVPLNLQCMQWAVGLRGAVAYALVVHMPTLKNGREREGNPAIETATLFIVCSSTLLLGGGTVKLLHYFRLDVRRPFPNFYELKF